MAEDGKYDWVDGWLIGTFVCIPTFCFVGILWFLTHW